MLVPRARTRSDIGSLPANFGLTLDATFPIVSISRSRSKFAAHQLKPAANGRMLPLITQW
jgi:hypothetical protein